MPDDDDDGVFLDQEQLQIVNLGKLRSTPLTSDGAGDDSSVKKTIDNGVSHHTHDVSSVTVKEESGSDLPVGAEYPQNTTRRTTRRARPDSSYHTDGLKFGMASARNSIPFIEAKVIVY